MTFCVLDQLEREWQRMADDPRAMAALGVVAEAAGGARTPEEVERFVRGAEPAAADRVLLPLVGRAVEGDRLAARVTLHLLLPGVRRLARTWWALGDHDERVAAAVAAVYDRICRYPLARRPRRVAANVLMDAAADLRRAVGGGHLVISGLPAGCEQATAADHDPAAENPAVELAALLRDAVDDGVLTRADAHLIAASRIAGTPLTAIARRHGAKVRTLQWRRQRAESALSSATRQGRQAG